MCMYIYIYICIYMYIYMYIYLFNGYAVIPPTPRDPLRTPLGTPWRPLEDPWGPLRTPWRLPWELRGRLGVSLGPLEDHLVVILDTLGSSWGQLGAPRDSNKLSKWPWETSWGPLRITFEASKAFTKRFAAMCQNLQICCKVLQNSRSRET